MQIYADYAHLTLPRNGCGAFSRGQVFHHGGPGCSPPGIDGFTRASPVLHYFSTGVLTHNHMKPLKLILISFNIIDHLI